MNRLFNRIASVITCWAGTVWAFMLAVISVVVWAALGPYYGWSDSHSLFINTLTTLITYLMVFIIQHTQNRQERAIQDKLNELIRSIDAARNEYIGIEENDDYET